MPTRPLPRAAVAALGLTLGLPLGLPLGLTLGLTLAPTFAAAQSSIAPVPTFRDADRLGKLTRAIPAVDSVMRSFMERSRVPGIAYGIVVDGKLLHVAAHGLRDVPSKARVDTSSVFRIASMTKSFTALAILQLRDAGKAVARHPRGAVRPAAQNTALRHQRRPAHHGAAPAVPRRRISGGQPVGRPAAVGQR
ncbi:serine hydrolase domain-containing protein [Gemmatimonas sp.]|uniref:serine hydrolase domain-containing protein n=1 Tax=Gemmatimonas sp. TaxID=1962908 RepID=UPI003DA40ACB